MRIDQPKHIGPFHGVDSDAASSLEEGLIGPQVLSQPRSKGQCILNIYGYKKQIVCILLQKEQMEVTISWLQVPNFKRLGIEVGHNAQYMTAHIKAFTLF